MIEVLLTVGLLIFLIGFNCLIMDASGWAFFCGTTGTFISLASAIIMYQESFKQPTAMDVYKGNTTLEITYKDGIPIDSVIVFKNKEK